jgi:hypothetical protein
VGADCFPQQPFKKGDVLLSIPYELALDVTSATPQPKVIRAFGGQGVLGPYGISKVSSVTACPSQNHLSTFTGRS